MSGQWASSALHPSSSRLPMDGGRFQFEEGAFYVGSQADGASQGLGVYRCPGGRGEYAGTWRAGFEESGVFRWSRGHAYAGQWLQGRRHGLGVEKLRDWIYRGEWTQGYKGRYGIRQSACTASKYQGSWTFGAPDGYGVETYADGGTYQGQWLRGVRHGYGIRQSASYDLALRLEQDCPPTVPLPEDEDPVLKDRDRRVHQRSGGGFVLLSRATPQDHVPRKGGLLLDKFGRPSLRRTIVAELRLIRHRSTGDILEKEPRAGPGSRGGPGGSVRSTVSTTSGKSSLTGQGYDDKDGSSLSLVDDVVGQEDLVERYWGEWKNDRRSGYGVCQRTDGLKYEGEWLDNKKNGYGVTTLSDGTRLEGKYRKNVLLASTSGGKAFLVRTGRLKERVENAVRAAREAEKIAKDKAEIANTRTGSSRVKADEAERVAEVAESQSQRAKEHAQGYDAIGPYPGNRIFTNRLREDEFLTDVAEFESACQPEKAPSSSSSSKFLSLFRSKRRPHVASVDFDPPRVQTPDPTQQESLGTAMKWKPQHHHQQQQQQQPQQQQKQQQQQQKQQQQVLKMSGGHQSDSRTQNVTWSDFPSGPKATVSTESNGRRADDVSQSGIRKFPPQTADKLRPDFPVTRESFRPQERYVPSQTNGPMISISQEPTGKHNFPGQTLERRSEVHRVPEVMPTAGFSWSTQGEAVVQQLVATTPGMISGPSFATEGQATAFPVFNQGQTWDGGQSDEGPAYHRTPGRRQAAAQIDLALQHQTQVGVDGSSQPHGSFYDPGLSVDLPGGGGRERRKSLPSIVKDCDAEEDLVKKSIQANPGTTTTALPVPSSGSKSGTTFVIEDGVRKRVTSVYGPQSPVRSLAVEGAHAGLPKPYRMEPATTTRRREMGSVPDVYGTNDVELPSRELVQALSIQRRQEIQRQREEEEKRSSGQIVLRIGDVTDWCARKKMLLVLLAVNYALVTVFYNMLQQH